MNCFPVRAGLVALLSLAALAPGATRAQEGFRDLFNGRDLSGWRGDMGRWSVEDGSITGRTTADAPLENNTFLIWDGGDVANFELELDYKIQGGNSGIQYRSQVLDESQFIVGGYQADIDATLKYAGICYEERGRGIIAQRGEWAIIDAAGAKYPEAFGDADTLGKKIHADQWNHYRLVAYGNVMIHSINGQLMAQMIDMQKDKRSDKGVLALQLHKGPPMVIQFKNIRLKTLD